MSKFTKGPWLQAEGDATFIYALNDQGSNRFWFLLQSSGKGSANNDELIANANLIKSAPDMYEALDMLCKLDEHDVYTSQAWSETFMAARKALAKADIKFTIFAISETSDVNIAKNAPNI